MKKIIPPVLLILCIVIMTGFHWLMPVKDLIPYPFNLVGLVFLFAGSAISVWTGKVFKKRKTEIHTFKEPRKLVTDGPFRHSRNPIYLGFVLLLTGVCILFGTVSPIIVVVAFIIITDRWYIKYEEKKMEAVFGDQYLKYRGRVRKWI
jgi:protein-S-isoprenylcysteine O-methyltransferase Ste14